MKEFWSDSFTEKSLQVLKKLNNEMKFILIGGWAVYLFTKSLKSKDVDIIVDFNNLNLIKSKYALNKNVSLKKYGFEVDGIDVDVYVPYFSKLAIPCESVKDLTTNVEGFTVPKIEVLVILKQQVEFVRKGIKAQKDRVDILSLLLEEIDITEYRKLIKKYKLEKYFERLRKIINESNEEWVYLGYNNPREIKKQKQKLLRKLQVVKK